MATMQTVQKVKAGRENWVKDGDVTNCSLCMATFSCVTRKHHCRACGNIFCASCSANEISFTPSTRKNEEGYKQKKKRVCKACYKNLDDVQRRLEKAMRATGGGSRLDLGSFMNPNMVITGSSIMGSRVSLGGNSFQADAGKRAGRAAIGAAPQAPTLALPILSSLNPFSWGGSSRGRATAAEGESASGHVDTEVVPPMVQQERKRHDSVAEPEQEPHMVPDRSPEDAPGTEAGELDTQCGGAAGKCLELGPSGGEEEEAEMEDAEMQELFSFYLHKLQEQKALLEAKLCAQQENERDFAETPGHAEAEAVDREFNMAMRKSNLYDGASPSLDFGRMLCDGAESQDACAQPGAETSEQGAVDMGVSESDRAKLLKLSLTVLKLSLKFEYRRKVMCDGCASETCSSTECPSPAQEVN